MSLGSDDRALSNVVGAVVLFGFLVILLSLYQGGYIPMQNEQVEFRHSQDVQNDMLEVRNAILSADTTGEPTYSTVKLGTRYPVRLVGINPPPAAGSLRTGDPEPVTVVGGDDEPLTGLCPGGDTIDTRTLSYTPGYHLYSDAPTIVYENTVLYLEFDGGTIPLTGQQLVQDDSVNILTLNSSIQENGVSSVSVEAVPGNVNEREIQDGTISVPTRLDESTWEDLLAGQVPPENVTVSGGTLSIDTSGEVAVTCSSIGVNEQPAGGQRQAADLDINPAGPNDVNLDSISRSGNTVTITLNNTADNDAFLTQARMSFYFNEQQPGGQDGVGPYDIENATTTFGDNFEILEPMQVLDPYPRLPGNDTQTSISFEFDQDGTSDNVNERDFFVVKFRFDNGGTGTYFVDIPS